MKRFTLALTLVLTMVMPLFAERVTPETAKNVATTFLSNNGAKASQLTDLSKSAGFPNLYIFTAEQGFVVMSADDCVKPILGYSLTGTFSAEDMPDHVRGWLQGYNDEIQYAIDNSMRATSETAKLWRDLSESKGNVAKANVVVAPLIQTKWNQNKYYNNLCPAVSDGPEGHAYTGCVATAMAQIMKYWEHPATGIGSHSYTWNGQTLSADFSSTTYDWGNMQPYYYCYYANGTDPYAIGVNAPTSEQLSAVSTLMYHCGVSVDMNYGGSSTGGSGAYSQNVAIALTTFFNYSTNIEYRNKDNYDVNVWIDMIKADLNERRPVQYNGRGSSGHAFVCDGYDDANYFHFNWGWSGHYDGYFSLNNLNTGANNESGSGNGVYTNEQSAIFGIQPATTGDAAAPVLTANLIQETGVRDIQLSWSEVTNASAYQLFCNSELIYSGSERSYRDISVPYGTRTYFVRSVDVNNNLSLPSNYVSITLTFAAPTNLTATTGENGIELSWSASENSVAYNLYCNGVVIERNIRNTNYTDNRIIAGDLTYLVKGVDSFGDESEPSESVSITIPYKTPIVNDLSLLYENGSSVLSWTAPTWCYPETETATLNYGQGSVRYSWNSEFYGHRHTAASLAQYAGMAIYKVSVLIKCPGTYSLYIYTNATVASSNDFYFYATQSDLATSITDVPISVTNSWFDFVLNTPIVLNGNNDLFVMIRQTDTEQEFAVPSFNVSAHNSNAFCSGWYSGTKFYIDDNHPDYNCAWFINTYLTDGTYTYNLYDGTNAVASNLTDTSYSIANITGNTLHQYTVRTNYYAGETNASNKASIALGTHSLTNLNLENDRMIVAENSKLTVSGNLTCSNPDHLVIENGAQLINDSENVKATVKKAVSPYTLGLNDGWNLIASPVIESLNAEDDIEGLLGDIYDLFLFDQSNTDENGVLKEWLNYKAGSFSSIDHKTGYLYANGEETTLSFVGTLAGTAEDTELTLVAGTEFAGFNLIGNPYPCNTYLGRPFYVLEYDPESDTTSFVLGNNDNPIAPCTAILVQAQTDGESVAFSKEQIENPSRIAVSLTQADQKGATAIDQARIVFQQQCQLAKYPQRGSAPMLYIPKNGEKLAVADSDGQAEMPINLQVTKNGFYTLTFDTENVDLDYLHLVDNMTGDDVDLLSTPSYTFEAKVNDHSWRFRLVFSNEKDIADNNEAFAFISNGSIIVNQDGVLQIVDMTGRVVEYGDAKHCISTREMTPGVYVLRLIGGDNVKTQKIVIE